MTATKFLLAGSAALALAGFATTAEARYRGVVCDGPFQVTEHGNISTPLCQERQIARVARSYGYRVSDGDVRHNDLTKINLCFQLGHDSRLKEACQGLRPGRRGF